MMEDQAMIGILAVFSISGAILVIVISGSMTRADWRNLFWHQ